VNSVAFSPDGKRIVSGGYDKTIRLWDVATGTQIGEPLRGHMRWVTSVAFSPDGKQIVSGSFDNTIRLWDAATGTQIGEPPLGHKGAVLSVAFSPDGKRIVSGSEDKTIRIWDGPAAWVELVCAKLTRNMGKKEWRKYVGDIPYEVQCPGLPVPE
jgi:WD40 repeat protein